MSAQTLTVENITKVKIDEISGGTDYAGKISWGKIAINLTLKFNPNWEYCEKLGEMGIDPSNCVDLKFYDNNQEMLTSPDFAVFKRPILLAFSLFIHMQKKGVDTNRWIKSPIILQEEKHLFSSPDDVIALIRNLNDV